MTEFVLAGCAVRVLLSHTALYGLASILDESGVPDVQLGWTAGMEPRPWVSGRGLDDEVVDDVVRRHAAQHAGPDSWVQHQTRIKGTPRGTLSPRLAPFTTDDEWTAIQTARHQRLDALTDHGAWADLRFLAALGEPAYWSRNRQNQLLQDDGASRLEMQPRNQGSEFVGNRLRKLATTVTARPPGAIATGLTGATCTDEIGSDKLDSRTPTGLSSPGATDNALAWCALWGIGQHPTAPRRGGAARTSGHLGRSHAEWFYTPVWTGPWQPARARTVLASAQLRDAATVDLPRIATEPSQQLAARSWLTARHVVGIVRFSVERFGSASAPERRAMLGTVLRTGDDG